MKNKTQWQYCYLCFIFTLFVSNAYAVSIQSMKLETGDGDGIIDSISYSIFDGCTQIENRSDNDADGIIDAIVYFTYDIGKYNQIAKNDLDADGNIDSISYYRQENSAGEERFISEEDLDGDGTIDSFQCTVSIDEGSSEIIKSYGGTGSYDGAGNLNRVTYYTKDANGKTVKEELDNDADGLIDEITYIKYKDCVPILQETDSDNDGKIDMVTQSTHDDKCRPLRTEMDSDLVIYGIRFISKNIYEMDYTDDVYGNPIKVETHATMSQIMMGKTVNQESTVIQYTTYEYAEGDCGPSTLCPICTNDEPVQTTYYVDADSDGYGDPNTSYEASSKPSGYVSNNTDCNDSDSTINPGATEICGDGIDQNCNGSDKICVTQTQVAELYVATFNRAPDAGGLNYWVDSGFTIEQIAMSFFDQSETKLLYPAGNTDAEFVTCIYQNLFNRAPDTDGLDYWIGPLGLGGGLARSVMIEALKNGATGADRSIIDNKTEVGLYCANHGSQAVEFSLSDITDDPTTVEVAKNAVDGF